MKKLLQTILLSALTLSFTHSAFAEDKSRFGISGKIQFSNWEGDNSGDNAANYDSDTTMASVAFRYQKGKLYAGASLQGGNYSFGSSAPDQQNEDDTSTAHSNVEIERGELDLIVGYYFWPRVSFFLDIKQVTNRWIDQDYEAKYAGLGLGISTFAPLPNNWTFYASLGFVPLKIKTDGSNIGDGSGSSLELGANYRITNQHNISVGLKAQNHEYEFDNNNKQTHNIGGLVVGYNYTFR